MVNKEINENTKNLMARRSPASQEGSQPRRRPGSQPKSQPGRPLKGQSGRPLPPLKKAARPVSQPPMAGAGRALPAAPPSAGQALPLDPSMRAVDRGAQAGVFSSRPKRAGRRGGAQPSGQALPGSLPVSGRPSNGRKPEASRNLFPSAGRQPSPALPQTVRSSGRVQDAWKRSAPYPRPRQNQRLSPEEALKLHKEQQHRQLVARALQHQELIFVLVLAVLTLFGLLFLFWPREAKSQNEKRVLAQAPQLTPASYFSGDWARGIEAFYADQFPFRSRLISLNQGVRDMIQAFPGQRGGPKLITARKDSGGQGDKLQNMTPEAGQKTAEEGSPQKGVDSPGSAPGEGKAAERNDAEASRLESQKAAVPTQGENILASAVPDNKQGENHDFETSNLVIDQGRAMEIFYYSPEYTGYYADRVSYLRSQLPEKRRVISLVAPTSIAFYGSDEMRSGAYSTYDAIKHIYESENGKVIKVDAYSKIAAHRDEYIYFRTDHHWNGLGAYYAYQAFCEATAQEATALSEMKKEVPEGNFLGTLYGFTGNSPLLLGSEDVAEMYLPRHYEGAKHVYFSGAAMDDPIENYLLSWQGVQDNQYMLYIGGDTALSLITSSNHNGKSILVIKDSYGNAFVPYLMDNYEKVFVLDPRQFKDNLFAFIDEQDIDDVLMLNYTFAVSNGAWLDGFDAMTGYEGN